MTTTPNSFDDARKVFEGKTLKQNLQDIIARNNTGYTYAELAAEIERGEDLLEDEEIEQVDKTVNLLCHLILTHRNAELKKLLEQKEELFARNETWHRYDIRREAVPVSAIKDLMKEGDL